MNKKLKYVIISWVVVLFAVLVEHYYLHNYLASQKVRQYALNAGNLFDEVDRKIGDLAQTGQLNFLMWSQGHMADELRLVKSVHPLIRDVLIFSDEFHLFDATSDRYSTGEITPLIEKAGLLKSGTSAVSRDGYLRIYPAVEGENKTVKGYIVAVLTAPPFAKGDSDRGSPFILNVTKGNLYLANEGYLNEAGAKLLRDKLRVAKMDESGSLKLKIANVHEVFWSYYSPGNLYFGYVCDAKAFYEYASFYVMVLCLLVNMVLMTSLIPNGNFRKSKKYEVYEKIIENNLETLSEMKKGVELLIQGGSKETVLEVGAVISSLPEHTMQPEKPVVAYYHKPEIGSSGEMISNFILLDPLDIKWYKPLKRKSLTQDMEKAGRLSRAAFTPELLELMEQISKKDYPGLPGMPEPEKQTAEPSGYEARKTGAISDTKLTGQYAEKYVEKIDRIEKDPFAAALERLYSVDEPGEELDIVLENIRILGKADGLAIMFFDRNIGCFTVDTSSGLDAGWPRNFYLLSTDSVLACPDYQVNNIIITDALLQNSFFRKRIPAEYLNRLGAIKLMTIQNKLIPVRAALFYWKDGDFFGGKTDSMESSLAEIDTVEYSRLFQEIMPVLNKIYVGKEKENVHPGESYRDIYNTLKSFTVLSDKKINIVHAVLSKPFDAEFRKKLQEKCKIHFKNYERYIVNNPTHLIFLLNETDPEFAVNIIQETDQNSDIKILKYPEMGKNLFTYL